MAKAKRIRRHAVDIAMVAEVAEVVMTYLESILVASCHTHALLMTFTQYITNYNSIVKLGEATRTPHEDCVEGLHIRNYKIFSYALPYIWQARRGAPTGRTFQLITSVFVFLRVLLS